MAAAVANPVVPTTVQPAAAAAPAASAASSTNAPATKQPSSKASAEPRRVRFNVGSKCVQIWCTCFLFRFRLTLINFRYHVMDVIGEGAYGVVCSAVHRPTGQKVAIKKVRLFNLLATSHRSLMSSLLHRSRPLIILCSA